MSKKTTGTYEWADRTFNCLFGCKHGCRYCYAREMAMDRHSPERFPTAEAWVENVEVRPQQVAKGWRKLDGRIMFPSTHDIWPDVMEPCLAVIGKILAAGNQILIVTKPHLEVIHEICCRFARHRDQILFRFSIGAIDPLVLKYWEPGAPNFTERWTALRFAYNSRFATSVSCEPLLDYDRVDDLIDEVRPFVSESIWIGKMNQIKRRVLAGPNPAEDATQLARVEAGQTDRAVVELYERYRHDPLIRWKDSYRKVLKERTKHE